MRVSPRRVALRTVSLLAFVLIVNASVSAAPLHAEAERPRPVVIYYGNETTEAAAASENYRLLLGSLRTYGGKDGSDLAALIERDATISPAVIDGETQALLDGCGRLNADIAVFTNRLAARGHFLFCRGAGGSVDTLPLPEIAPAREGLLNLTPLSRPEVLQAALEAVAAMFPHGAVDAVLITHSHGDPAMALMPRVSADVASLPPETLQHILDFRGSAPDWAALKGTRKIDYWQVLARLHADHGMRFSLVFRQACESGLNSFGEYRAIPDGVALVAHTAMSDLPAGAIDYQALMSAAATKPDVAQAFAEALSAQGMHVDSKSSALRWLVPVYLWSLPSAVWFAPIALWIGWIGWMLGASALSRAREAPRATTGVGAKA